MCVKDRRRQILAGEGARAGDRPTSHFDLDLGGQLHGRGP
jgi:hypothetical protein